MSTITAPSTDGARRSRPRVPVVERLARGADPRWVRPALFALLALTALAYLWDLSASGYANSFYAAAVQAGTKSWKAFFFGSLDSSSFITVDKPPASLWVMALSGRIFGFSSWSLLVPQALEGVAAVALLYGAIRRWFGAAAGLLAGAVLAATPVAALMFRFDNPDALLVCLLVASAYCLTRALEGGRIRWVVACGSLVGFAFLAKMMQAFLVLPAFLAVWMLAAPISPRRRFVGVAAGAGALIAAAGWWVLAVMLWPVGSRPFIDGSPDNSILNLILGYNGFGRIFGSGGPGGGGGGGANFSGAPGVLRLFNDLMGGQASWLIPAALLALVAGLWARRGAPRSDRTRAALVLWGGWLLVTAAVFSLSSGVIHTYYTVALAPAIAALVAIGAAMLWERRDARAARIVAGVAVAATAAWSYALLDRTPSWHPWLRVVVVVVGALAAAALALAPAGRRIGSGVTAAVTVAALVACLAGPVAYAADTVTTAHTGSIPSAGPASASGGRGAFGGPGGSGAGGGRGGPAGATRSGGGGFAGPGAGGPPRGGEGPTGGVPLFGSSGSSGGGRSGGAPSTSGVPFGRGSSGATGGGAAPGGATASTALVRALESDASHYRWVAATNGSQSAATLELATGGDPVMAIGGFNGQGGRLTLAQFERYVAAGDIHYYIAAGGAGGPGGGDSSSAITSWVESHFTARTIGGETVYDLTSPKA